MYLQLLLKSYRFHYLATCLFLLLAFNTNYLKSQVRLEPVGNYKANAPSFNFYEVSALTKEKIPYSRIKGSPFWKDEWQLATLYSGKTKITTIPVKLNMASGAVHFLRDEREMVLENDNISTIVLHPGKDVTKTAEVFIMNDEDLKLNNTKVEGFSQVLNSGSYRLLKYTLRKVNSADSLFGTQKKYFFSDQFFYFLWHDDEIVRIKKLNKEQVTKYLPSSSKYEAWIAENKIDFRRENDVARFLHHYNTQQTKAAQTNNQK